MVALRNFSNSDVEIFQEKHSKHLSIDEKKDLFRKWNKREYGGKYFEMLAIVKNEEIVGRIALHNSLNFETDEYVYRNKKGNEVLIYIKALA